MTLAIEGTRMASDGIGFGEGDNQIYRSVWHLDPDGNGPPVKVRMFAVDAAQNVKNFPDSYRLWWPGDATPERRPMTDGEREAKSIEGRIKKLEAEKDELRSVFEQVRIRVDAQIELLRADQAEKGRR